MNPIVKDIIEFATEKGSMSYVNIERIFESHDFDYEGDVYIAAAGYPNDWFWCGWNTQAFDLLQQAVKLGELERNPCQPFIYLVDGKALKLPLVKSERQYKKPHWLPVVFDKKKEY